MLCPNPKCQEDIAETVSFCTTCGAQIRRRRSHNVVAAVGRGLVPGEIFKFRFRIEGFLGSGGATVSYAARDQEFDDLPVALRILPSEVVMDDQFRAQLAREARAGLTLIHENICRLHYFMGKAQLAYFVSELVPGPSLEMQRNQEATEDGHQRWALSKALDLLMPVADAIDFAHSLGILHRELKPSNIILGTKNGKVVPKITDFGISAVLRDAIDEQDGLLPVESRFYLAPERLRKETVSPATDVYSLGLILYQLLAGQLPFKLSDWEKKITGQEAPEPIEDLSHDVNQSILKALDPESERRYASATQFLSAVRVTAGLGPAEEVRIVVTEPQFKSTEPEIHPSREKADTSDDLPFFMWILGAVIGGMIIGAVIGMKVGGPDQPSIAASVRPSVPMSPSPLVEPSRGPVSIGSPRPSASPLGSPDSGVIPPSPPVTELAGAITFETKPSGAEVFIDGKSTDVTTPCTLTGVPAGKILFAFKHPDCEVLEREELLEPGRPVLFQVALARFEISEIEKNPQGLRRFKNLRDGAIMVQLPGSTLLMDETEITNSMYRRFIEATGYKNPTQWVKPQFTDPEQPVVGVSWRDAAAYAEWAGKQLPPEDVWERAARGGLPDRRYPWGDEDPEGRAEFGKDYETGRSVRVRFYPPNGLGLYDMAGNVWEWCVEKQPVPPGRRVIRGGSFLQAKEAIDIKSRNALKEGFADSTAVGFRCIKRLPSGFPENP